MASRVDRELEMAQCLEFAVFAGLLTSASNNIVAWFHEYASRQGKDITRCQDTALIMVNIFLNLLGVAAFLVSLKHGPVAIAMPILIAAKLLASMIFHVMAKIGNYGKSTRVGTLVLCAASLCLLEVGPDNPESVDLAELAGQWQAQVWLGFVGVLLVMSFVCYFWNKDKPGSDSKIAYAMIVGLSTALGASVGKVITLVHGAEQAEAVLLYLLFGFLSFTWSAFAALSCDMSVYMPLTECLQLIVNCINGLIIWGDSSRVNDRVSYVMTYLQLCLGVYLTTSFDVLSTVSHRNRGDKLTGLVARLTKQRAPQHGRTSVAVVIDYENIGKRIEDLTLQNLENQSMDHAEVAKLVGSLAVLAAGDNDITDVMETLDAKAGAHKIGIKPHASGVANSRELPVAQNPPKQHELATAPAGQVPPQESNLREPLLESNRAGGGLLPRPRLLQAQPALSSGRSPASPSGAGADGVPRPRQYEAVRSQREKDVQQLEALVSQLQDVLSVPRATGDISPQRGSPAKLNPQSPP